MLTGIGLGVACPEGSSTNAAYTGPLNPAGGNCRCYDSGWIWYNGKCQSPQSVGQQAGSGVYKSYAGMTVQEQMEQDLTSQAKEYFRVTGHSISCKLVWPSPVPGVTSYPTRMCSIDGGPYVHGAYAVNLNPATAINSEISRRTTENVLAGKPYSEELARQANQQVIRAQGVEVNNIVDVFNSIAQAARNALGGGSGGNGGSSPQTDDSNQPTDSGLDIFGQSVDIFGYDVPILALVAAGGLLLWSNKS